MLKVGGSLGIFFLHRKQSSTWLSGYLCHTGVVREIPAAAAHDIQGQNNRAFDI